VGEYLYLRVRPPSSTRCLTGCRPGWPCLAELMACTGQPGQAQGVQLLRAWRGFNPATR
jgi:hypothetical protein